VELNSKLPNEREEISLYRSHLPAPNWKEKKQLGAKLEEGYRLVCQLWLSHDLELAQDDKPLEPLAPASP